MGDKLPKLTAKEAENCFFKMALRLIDKKAVIEFISKAQKEWFCHTIVAKFYTLKSPKNCLRF